MLLLTIALELCLLQGVHAHETLCWGLRSVIGVPSFAFSRCSESVVHQNRCKTGDGSLSELSAQLKPGDTQYFEAGSLLGSGHDRGDEGSEDPDNSTIGSVIIRRQRSAKRVEQEQASKQALCQYLVDAQLPFNLEPELSTETYVSPVCLNGVLPGALLDAYKFWKTSTTCLRGYPRAVFETDTFLEPNARKDKQQSARVSNHICAGSMILVRINPDDDDRYGLVFRLPQVHHRRALPLPYTN